MRAHAACQSMSSGLREPQEVSLSGLRLGDRGAGSHQAAPPTSGQLWACSRNSPTSTNLWGSKTLSQRADLRVVSDGSAGADMITGRVLVVCLHQAAMHRPGCCSWCYAVIGPRRSRSWCCATKSQCSNDKSLAGAQGRGGSTGGAWVRGSPRLPVPRCSRTLGEGERASGTGRHLPRQVTRTSRLGDHGHKPTLMARGETAQTQGIRTASTCQCGDSVTLLS